MLNNITLHIEIDFAAWKNLEFFNRIDPQETLRFQTPRATKCGAADREKWETVVHPN